MGKTKQGSLNWLCVKGNFFSDLNGQQTGCALTQPAWETTVQLQHNLCKMYYILYLFVLSLVIALNMPKYWVQINMAI